MYFCFQSHRVMSGGFYTTLVQTEKQGYYIYNVQLKKIKLVL